MKELSVAPLTKNYDLGKNERLPIRRDVRPLTSGEITNGAISFFQENSATDRIGRHYNQPLAGGRKRILALGFTVTHPILEESSNVDPLALINQLRHSAVRLTIGDREKQVLRGHLANFIQFNKVEVEQEAYNDGTNQGSLTAVHVRTVPLRRLSDTSLENTMIAEGQRFTLSIRPQDTSAFPTDSNWATARTPEILAQMQLGYPPGEAPGAVGPSAAGRGGRGR